MLNGSSAYVFNAYAHTCRANAVLGVYGHPTAAAAAAHDDTGLPGAVCARGTPLNGV